MGYRRWMTVVAMVRTRDTEDIITTFENRRKEKLLNLAAFLENSRLRFKAMCYPGYPSNSQEPDTTLDL